jgi:hypothetical protein
MLSLCVVGRFNTGLHNAAVLLVRLAICSSVQTQTLSTTSSSVDNNRSKFTCFQDALPGIEAARLLQQLVTNQLPSGPQHHLVKPELIIVRQEAMSANQVASVI